MVVGRLVWDLHAAVSGTDFDSCADGEDGEAQDLEDLAEESVHLETIPAFALLYDLFE